MVRAFGSVLAAVAAPLSMIGAALAEEPAGRDALLHRHRPDWEIIATLGVDSTGSFRGILEDRVNPNPWAALDIERGDFYIGAFASPVGFDEGTVPFAGGYGGYAPTAFGFDFNFGGTYYSFPGSAPLAIDLNGDMLPENVGKKALFEAFAGASKTWRFAEVELLAFYSPNTFGETGESQYYAAELTVPLPHAFEFAAHYGVSEFANDLYNDDYTDYSVGVKRSLFGFDLGLRYSNVADLADADEEAIIFTLSREFSILSPDAARERRYRKVRNNWVLDKSLLGIRH
jgi:uncharacterized protein (TIGR02001 family)